MAVEHLHNHAQYPRAGRDRNLSVWWYEDRRGLEFLMEHRDKDGDYVRTVSFIVPWGRLRDALARFDKPRSSQSADSVGGEE